MKNRKTSRRNSWRPTSLFCSLYGRSRPLPPRRVSRGRYSFEPGMGNGTQAMARTRLVGVLAERHEWVREKAHPWYEDPSWHVPPHPLNWATADSRADPTSIRHALMSGAGWINRCQIDHAAWPSAMRSAIASPVAGLLRIPRRARRSPRRPSSTWYWIDDEAPPVVRKVSQKQRVSTVPGSMQGQKPSGQGIYSGFAPRLRLCSALALAGCSLRFCCADATCRCLWRSWWFACD
jgi:hypothetical protein